MINKKFLLVILLGLLVRLPLMSMPGTEDMDWFRSWGALALRHGIVNVYSLSDSDALFGLMLARNGIPYHPRIVNQTDLGSFHGVPDYPPGNVITLEFSVALCKFLQRGSLRAGPLLNACVNLFPLFFSLGIALAIWFFARRTQSPRGLEALASFWLNPAIILTSPLLGYQDPIFAFFSFCSLIMFYRRRFTLCVLCLAAGCLTKPQGVFIVPVLAAAFFAEGGWPKLWRLGLRFLLFLLLPLVPFILANRILGLLAGLYSQTIMFPLAAQQLNVWWLVGALLRSLADHSWRVLQIGVPMVGRDDFNRIVGFRPIWIALPAFALFTVANLYYLVIHLRAGRRWAVFWSAALEVLGYNMLMIYTHENHLFSFFVYTLPLIALGNKLVPRLFWMLSTIYALNLFLFQGLGVGHEADGHWLRILPGFDLTIFIALVNVGIFLLLLRAKNWWFDQVGWAPNTPGQAS